VESGGCLDGRQLRQLRPADEGILVLGIRTGDAHAHRAAVAEQDRVASRERVRSGPQEHPGP
jgi:hypothetical protein